MPSGLRTLNEAGQVQLDIDTITSRVIGSIVVSSATPVGGIVQTVPVTAGKQLWVFYYVTGGPRGLILRNTPATNMFTYYMNTDEGSGQMIIFYGEC